MKAVRMFFARIFDMPIAAYQKYISPLTPRTCRYAPSCSEYARESLRVHGVLKGTLLSVWRILRCNPWSKGGVDRVPAKGKWPARPLDIDELHRLYAKETSSGLVRGDEAHTNAD